MPGRVIIVGGGASGVILAVQLLRRSNARLRVALVEQRAEVGAGIAYGTDDPVHLLNTRAGSMSALVDEPDDFWRWLLRSGHAAALGCTDPYCFVPRRLYRLYLQDLIRPWLPQTGDGRLQIIAGECTDVTESTAGVAVSLRDGPTELAQAVVLATGHAAPAAVPHTLYSKAWCSPAELGIRTSDDVVILGTGLSMIDNATQLREAGHRGSITALSRRALLPQIHRRSTPLKLDAADIPLGTGPSFLLQWLRRTARWAEQRGGDWRDLVDALRPHTPSLWQSLSPEGKARFIRHARTFWEVHRHRLPPQADLAVRQALEEGHLRIVAGRLLDIELADERKVLTIRGRGGRTAMLVADHVIDCMGILRDPGADRESLVGHQVARGAAQIDPLRIGIEVDADCALVASEGRPSARIFAVGPLTRARFWEITAIPDIRTQCADVATLLLARLDSPYSNGSC